MKNLYLFVAAVLFLYLPVYGQAGSDSTFDIVTWNLEWFGSDSNGPDDETLQKNNVAKVLQTIDADVYALQEITSQESLNALTEQLNTNIGISDYYKSLLASYITQSQKTAFIYKKDVVKLTGNFYGAIEQGQDYYDWAGRLPFFMEFDTNVNGVTKRIFAVTIHAKANYGTTEEKETSYTRRKDAAESLYSYLNGSKKNDSIILLGDYNDDVDESIFQGKTSPYILFVGDTDNFEILTKPLSESNQHSTVSYSDMIDHITISYELFQYNVANSTQIHSPASYISNYGNSTTDHYPVFTSFYFGTATPNEFNGDLPTSVTLHQNYPNPFNPSTNIAFSLPTNDVVSLFIYDMLGRRVFTLAERKPFSAGEHSVHFDAVNLNSGIYYYRLVTRNGFSITRTMTLIK